LSANGAFEDPAGPSPKIALVLLEVATLLSEDVVLLHTALYDVAGRAEVGTDHVKRICCLFSYEINSLLTFVGALGTQRAGYLREIIKPHMGHWH
jgi:hypothetical protein